MKDVRSVEKAASNKDGPQFPASRLHVPELAHSGTIKNRETEMSSIPTLSVHRPIGDSSGFFRKASRALDYETGPGQSWDVQAVIAVGMMVGGALGSIGIGSWAMYTRTTDQLMLWPLIGSGVLLIVGFGWWFLNRRNLT